MQKPNDVNWLAPRQQRQKKGLVDGNDTSIWTDTFFTMGIP
jgi:hypothetical protein